MTEYSYDAQDTEFRNEEERQFFDDVEFVQERNEPQREKYRRDQPARTYRSEGVDVSEATPLTWIEFRGRQRLQETFSDGDGDYLGNDEEIINSLFNLFRVDNRSNHWF